MNTVLKIKSLSLLGDAIRKDNPILVEAVSQASIRNPWFTVDNCWQALETIKVSFLNKDVLENWVSQYALGNVESKKRVGLILAGNIPGVGFHDVLSVFITDNISLIKYSEKDNVLIPCLLKILGDIAPEAIRYFERIEKLTEYEAVIATGSNNSSRYFEQYFKNAPHIIRKNRNAVAILNGEESKEDLMRLGNDIFNYFGLGCRNVSKVYLPKDYDIENFMEVLHSYNDLINHNKYKNNFDFNYALFMLNKIKFYNNGCIILREEETIASRIASLHYSYYNEVSDVVREMKAKSEQVQCLVSNFEIETMDTVPFGAAQKPSITDYADGIDTIQFLLSID